MYKKIIMLGVLIATLFSVSCSDDDKGPDEDPSAAHKIVFKAEVSNGNLIDATYGVDADAHTATSLSGTNWSSAELPVPAGAYNANLLVNAGGTTENTVLTVRIYVDNQLKVEKTSNPGKVVSVLANYKF